MFTAKLLFAFGLLSIAASEAQMSSFTTTTVVETVPAVTRVIAPAADSTTPSSVSTNSHLPLWYM